MISDEDADSKVFDVVNDTDNFTYYAVSITFITSIVLMAIIIDDLTFLFGIIAAFSESMLNFVFPGLFYLIGRSITKTGLKAINKSREENEV